MAGFLLAAALLVAVTLLLLLRPWRRKAAAEAAASAEVNASVLRDQLREIDRDLAAGTLSPEDHAQARADLQRRVLEDTTEAPVRAASAAPFGMGRTALLLVVALPLASAGLYAWLGTPAALDPTAEKQITAEDVDRMVAGLAAKLEANPDDTRGWIVLARSYRALRRIPEAEAAYARIGDALNKDPTLLVEYADVLATRAMGNFSGRPAEMVQRALQLDPDNVPALSLSATTAYNSGDMRQAIAHWQHLQKLIPPESEDGKWLAEAIKQVSAEMAASAPGAKPQNATTAKADTKPAAQAATNPTAAAAGPAVTGRVTLSPSLADKVQPTDTVFVFARAPQGSRMPLAVQRARVADLPLDFKLDDATAMSPELRLSGAAEVRIEARISRSGSATPSPGDLIGAGPVVKPGAKGVAVQIDSVRP
jgi:cytochrome c-type biogenesis protein CcmH